MSKSKKNEPRELSASSSLAWMADTEMERGTSRRICCLICNGGTSNEKSLSVTLTESGTLYWKCWRASCGWKGARNAHSYEEFKPKTKPPRPFEGSLVTLTDEQLEFFYAKFGLRSEHLRPADVRYSSERDRFSFTVRGPTGKERGSTLRSYAGLQPKSLTYRTRPNEPFIGWYGKGRTVIVEDIPSALKIVAAGGQGVALCGTTINLDIAGEIQDYGTDLVLALDDGTMPLMLKYQRQFEPVWGDITIWELEKDLKYEPITSIREALFDGKTSFKRSPEGPQFL